MAQPAFGLLLQRLREERRLSLREFGQLAELDHAYIHRLESGEKDSPSEETQSKLVRALKASKREGDVLRYLAEHAGADPGLVDYMLSDATVTTEEFRTLAGTAFRGTGRSDYAKQVQRVRRYLAEASEDG